MGDEQESLNKQVQKLVVDQNSLLLILKEFDHDYEKDPEIKVFKSGEFGKETSQIETDHEAVEPVESELERNVRLGEVTAFGTSLTSKSSEGSKGAFDAYLNNQI